MLFVLPVCNEAFLCPGTRYRYPFKSAYFVVPTDTSHIFVILIPVFRIYIHFGLWIKKTKNRREFAKHDGGNKTLPKYELRYLYATLAFKITSKEFSTRVFLSLSDKRAACQLNCCFNSISGLYFSNKFLLRMDLRLLGSVPDPTFRFKVPSWYLFLTTTDINIWPGPELHFYC